MDFDIEWNLQEFRREQPELFDESGKRYTGVDLSNNTAEAMLKIIDDLEAELALAECSKKPAALPIFDVSKSYCGEDGDDNIKADLREIYDACGNEQEFIRLYNEMKLEKDEQDFDNYMEDKVSNL